MSLNHTVQINQYNVHAKIKSYFFYQQGENILLSPLFEIFGTTTFILHFSFSYCVLFLNCVLFKQCLPIMLLLMIYLVSLKEETKCRFKQPLRFRITQTSEFPNSKHTDLVLTSTASHSPHQPGITGQQLHGSL